MSDEQAIIEFLASQPTPAEVLALHASPTLQQCVSELLARSKAEGLSREEERELDRIFGLEHLVRLAKAQALKDLRPDDNAGVGQRAR